MYHLNTLVDWPRLEMITDLLHHTEHLKECVAEVGVYKGGTAALIHAQTTRHLFLFDTFEGMPDVKPIDLHHKGDFSDTSLEHVAGLLDTKKTATYSIYKGVFPRQNTEVVSFRKFSFVHLDVDIYDSVRECLEFFHPRMVKGSVIALDDYLEPNCPGAKLAADEFMFGRTEKIMPTVQSQAIIQF